MNLRPEQHRQVSVDPSSYRQFSHDWWGELSKYPSSLIMPCRGVLSEMAFYEKVIKVKADVAAYLINCISSA